MRKDLKQAQLTVEAAKAKKGGPSGTPKVTWFVLIIFSIYVGFLMRWQVSTQKL